MEKSDLEIINALRDGDRGAFYELYHRYSDLIYRNILVRVASSSDADDIFQDFFIKLWEKRASLKVDSYVKGYLLVWLKHHILNTIKEQQIRNKYNEAFYSQTEVLDENTWDKITSEDLHTKIKHTISTLPPRLQTVYFLSREENLSVKEIAKRLSTSEQTVKNQLNEMLKRLRKELDDKFFLFFL